MARWKEEELAHIARMIEEKNGVLLGEDHQALQAVLLGRSVAAIKKKYIEVKNQNQIQNQRDNRREERATTITKAVKWSEEEERRLVTLYRQRPESQSGARIKVILPLFPGRTLKGIAT